jgi:drug/metabolite transporter (DMT)-like permease
VLVILVSLAAAMAFAVAVVMQQHAAIAQPAEHHLRFSLLLRLVRRPLWLAGIGASVVGTALQLVALVHGSLVTVQPILVCGLLFALPINAIWVHSRRPGARELLAAVTVCLGLVVLLVATDPRRGSGTGSGEGWAIALGSLGFAVVVLVSCSLAARKPTWKAGLLACAGGLINGLSAAFAKGMARGIDGSLHHGLGAVITHTLGNWELYAFCGSLLCGVFLVQSAFQSGPIRWSLPALAAANPIASVILGATLLHEHIRSGVLPILGAAVGLSLVVVGIMALSSSKLIVGDPDESVALNLSGAVVPPTAVLAGDPTPSEPLRLPAETPLQPKASLPSADLPSADLPSADLPSADLPSADLPSADEISAPRPIPTSS